MADVKWIKLNVGMFDGNSFKRIKKAKIGGESFRDKLTAVWFELMDFAGKCNANGYLIESPEIPFSSIDDIAIIIDRETEELNLCMQYFISNRMITVIDDVYMLTNWEKYQNVEGLEKIREQNRIRQKKWYDNKKALQEPNVRSNVSLTQSNATEGDKERRKKKEDKELIKEGEGKENKKESDPPHPQQVIDLFNSICVSFPSVKFMSAKRKTAIEQIENTYTLDDFKQCFEIAEKSAFLKGENKRNWIATFDWLISEENMTKVLEGNYNDKKKAQESGGSNTDEENEYFLAAFARGQRYLQESKKEVKTAGEDDSIRERAERLKELLG